MRGQGNQPFTAFNPQGGREGQISTLPCSQVGSFQLSHTGTSYVDSNFAYFGALPVNLYQRLRCHVCIYLYHKKHCKGLGLRIT